MSVRPGLVATYCTMPLRRTPAICYKKADRKLHPSRKAEQYLSAHRCRDRGHRANGCAVIYFLWMNAGTSQPMFYFSLRRSNENQVADPWQDPCPQKQAAGGGTCGTSNGAASSLRPLQTALPIWATIGPASRIGGK